MPCYLDKMRMIIKIEDIIFWVAIVAVIGLIIWKLFGSPTDLATIITVASLLAMGELSLLKKAYSLERKVAVGFTRVSSDMNLIRNDIKHHLNYIRKDLDNINNKLVTIENLIKNKK